MTKINLSIKTPAKIDYDGLKDQAQKVFDLLKKDDRYEFELNIICSNKMKELNRKFRQKNMSTTILTFVSRETKGFVDVPSKYEYLGEIFLCPMEIKRQAKVLEISTENYMTTLLVHGILHLLGYTHKTKKEMMVMENKEEELLKALKIHA